MITGRYRIENESEMRALLTESPYWPDEDTIREGGFDPEDPGLSAYLLLKPWNGHPAGSLVIAGLLLHDYPLAVLDRVKPDVAFELAMEWLSSTFCPAGLPDQALYRYDEREPDLTVGNPVADGCVSIAPDDTCRVWVGGEPVASLVLVGAWDWARETYEAAAR